MGKRCKIRKKRKLPIRQRRHRSPQGGAEDEHDSSNQTIFHSFAIIPGRLISAQINAAPTNCSAARGHSLSDDKYVDADDQTDQQRQSVACDDHHQIISGVHGQNAFGLIMFSEIDEGSSVGEYRVGCCTDPADQQLKGHELLGNNLVIMQGIV